MIVVKQREPDLKGEADRFVQSIQADVDRPLELNIFHGENEVRYELSRTRRNCAMANCHELTAIIGALQDNKVDEKSDIMVNLN